MIRVIVCTHNGVRFLEAQLASIMEQNRPVDVVHLFDFASSDGTRELLVEFAARWPKLDARMVDHAPGVTLSFFHAFAEIAPNCGGDDVIFLSDQDDVWLPDKTEKMLDRLESEHAQGNDRVLAFHDVRICDEELRVLRQSFYEGRPFRVPRDLARERLLIANPVIGHTIALTKPLLDLALDCLRPAHYAMHDWALVLLAAHAAKIVYVPEQLGLYRQHDSNILGAARRRSVLDYLMRGLRLSQTISTQAAAFIEDFRCAARRAGLVDPPTVLPGKGPFPWRLGLVIARQGHTFGHRLMAIGLLKRLLRHDRSPWRDSSQSGIMPDADVTAMPVSSHLSFSQKASSPLLPAQIAVVGTRGVPARYGGFETLAEQLARNIDARSVRLTFYGQRSSYTIEERRGGFGGHRRVWLPFSAGGAQSLIHDALQLFHAAFLQPHSQILLLGTSAAWLLPLVRLFRPRLRIVTNIDGLEWRRDKFGALARSLLKGLESLAVRYSDAVIADNAALVPMVRQIHGVDPVMIAYGADQVELAGNVESDPNGYLLAIARVEPENNTALILEAARKAKVRMVFVGNWNSTEYGRSLLKEYGSLPELELRSPIYDQTVLAGIRSGSSAYVHGHSVGGTNPSLVEAIFHSSRILAFDCVFNRSTLDNEGSYFTSVEDLADLMEQSQSGWIAPESKERLRQRYRWSEIVRQYLDVLTCK